VKKVLFVALVVIVAGAYGFRQLDTRAFEGHSRNRVQGMLASLQAEGLGGERDAVGYGRRGDPDAFDQDSYISFRRFRDDHPLESVRSFEVVSAEVVAASDTFARSVVVRCRVDGRPLCFPASLNEPLEWVGAGQ
jgi:hypothetical protein